MGVGKEAFHNSLNNLNFGLWIYVENKMAKNLLSSVIPAEAGIHDFDIVRILWIPVFTGMTTFYEIINFKICQF